MSERETLNNNHSEAVEKSNLDYHLSLEDTPVLFWETLYPIIGGLSAIDSSQLHISNYREAEEFLESYGYDFSYEPHRLEMEKIRREALSFIEEELLADEDNLSIPPEIREERDIRKLLLLASGPVDEIEQNWACALLRVMHTFVHSRSYFNELFGDEIRQQILNRFSPHLRKTEEGGLFLGAGDEAIPLFHFEFKHTKPLRSIVMKLLHKPENVAADIFDRIGLRFVTRDKLDALLVIRYLRRHHVIMFANIKPSRSRNTLIDLEWLRREIEIIDELIKTGRFDRKLWLEKLRQKIQAQPYPYVPPDPIINPFRSIHYHSIQFTCRQMIRIPVKKFVQCLSSSFHNLSPFLAEKLSNQDEISFFFPYEVQVMDIESFRRSRSGLASHEEYKKRQRDTVKIRVLRKLLWL